MNLKKLLYLLLACCCTLQAPKGKKKPAAGAGVGPEAATQQLSKKELECIPEIVSIIHDYFYLGNYTGSITDFRTKKEPLCTVVRLLKPIIQPLKNNPLIYRSTQQAMPLETSVCVYILGFFCGNMYALPNVSMGFPSPSREKITSPRRDTKAIRFSHPTPMQVEEALTSAEAFYRKYNNTTDADLNLLVEFAIGVMDGCVYRKAGEEQGCCVNITLDLSLKEDDVVTATKAYAESDISLPSLMTLTVNLAAIAEEARAERTTMVPFEMRLKTARQDVIEALATAQDAARETHKQRATREHLQALKTLLTKE